jgi:hypothetical protein
MVDVRAVLKISIHKEQLSCQSPIAAGSGVICRHFDRVSTNLDVFCAAGATCVLTTAAWKFEHLYVHPANPAIFDGLMIGLAQRMQTRDANKLSYRTFHK